MSQMAHPRRQITLGNSERCSVISPGNGAPDQVGFGGVGVALGGLDRGLLDRFGDDLLG